MTQHFVDRFHAVLLQAIGTTFALLKNELQRFRLIDVVTTHRLDQQLDRFLARKGRHCNLVEEIEPWAFDSFPFFADLDTGDDGTERGGKFTHEDTAQLLLNQMVEMAQRIHFI